jgi:hypothetical protein
MQMPNHPMTQSDASRIQSATAKQSGGGVPAGSFSSRAQSTADSRAYAASKTGGNASNK